MPKSVIREYDNSTAGTILSSNFSVLVPGYPGAAYTEESKLDAKKNGIYFEDANVYKLSSAAQFEKYIGEFSSEPTPAHAPILETLNPSEPEDSVNRYRRTLAVRDFAEADGYNFYLGTTLEPTDPGYGENGYLLKKFDIDIGVIETYRFTPVSVYDLYDDLETDPVTGEVVSGYTRNMYFKIKVGNEGNDTFAFGDSLGNKIAYNLLNVGYVVYFKILDKTKGAAVQMSSPEFWEALKNKSTYRLRYITTGGCYDAKVAEQIVALANFNNNVSIEEADTFDNATGRGDCIALLDVDEESIYFEGGVLGDVTIEKPDLTIKSNVLSAFANSAKLLPANKYAAIFAPKVIYSGDEIKYPCSYHYLLCAIQSQERYAEWYAVAGYARGIASKSIAYTTYTFGDIDINTLAPRIANSFVTAGAPAINLILSERGSYYLWGNRTAYPIDAKGLIFSHFLNIRQLCCTLKQVLFDASRQFTFDPNSDLLWINFVNAIRPTLEKMKADQGIKGYKISKVATDKKALLVAKIRIVPIEAVEDFDISVYLEDSLSGVVVATDEEEAE